MEGEGLHSHHHVVEYLNDYCIDKVGLVLGVGLGLAWGENMGLQS